MLGKVKRWYPVQGFGFIGGEDGNDYLAHYSRLLVEPDHVDGRRNLMEGETVRFTPFAHNGRAGAKDVQYMYGKEGK